MPLPAGVADPGAVGVALDAHDYLADEGLATVVFLALRLDRPLLLEGEPGVGKTELAKTLARWTGGRLLRLQCHEGIDAGQALYEWDHARQLLHLRAAEAAHATTGRSTAELESELYQERFLLRRPILDAISHDPAAGPPPVLLVDELDRADDEFDAFLLEVLSDWSVTIPELGTLRAAVPPIVVITSNRTRELHDALKRRCLYHWIDHPDAEREAAIVARRVPGADTALTRQAAEAVGQLRALGLGKPPGVAETIDWVHSLAALGARELDAVTARATLGTVVKDHDDLERVIGSGLLDEGRGVTDAASPPRRVGLATAPPRRADLVAALRSAGLAVPVDAVLTHERALEALDPARRADQYWAGRATLVTDRAAIAVYDDVFTRWWSGDAAAASADVAHPDPPPPAAATKPAVRVQASDVEVLRTRAFADCSPAELDELSRAMASLARAGGRRRSRRRRPARRATGHLDLRRTARSAAATEGELLRRHHRERITVVRSLVLLLDISGSMESSTRAMLRFAHALVVGRRRVAVFTLGTRVTRVTRELSSRDPDAALAAVGRAVVDWSGGTRLGEGMAAFLDGWGARGVARGADVVVVSDGWERGDPALLGQQVERLARLAHRLLWVNPLAGTEGYQPLARGMAAALPHVDALLPGHDLASLDALARLLDDDRGRP